MRLRAMLLGLAVGGLWASAAMAAPVCTLVVEAASGAVVARSGPDCERPNSPASTFKIPLAVLGYEAGILTTATAPLWPDRPEYGAAKPGQAVDPTIWQRDSVIWYSREITRRLGAGRFQRGVHRLAYGNGDLSGDPGQNNGLTHAWLSSSLQISPLGQVAFLRALVRDRLPVSRAAMTKTRAILPVFATANGWTIHGKTGTGFQPRPGGGVDRDRQFGWFVGWGEKDGRRLVFARLIKDTGPEAVRAGFRARDSLLADWPDLVKGH